MDKNQERPHKTILVVEDAEEVRMMVSSMLRHTGYRVHEASNGRDALCLLESCGDPIDLVLTDLIMPYMDGVELARHLAQIRPALRVLLMSGYNEHPVVHSLERGSFCFLPKPFTANTLLDVVEIALNRPWTGLPLANSPP